MTETKSEPKSDIDNGIIRLYDTWNEKYFTVTPGIPLKIYICGPTVYTDTHVGHLKTYMTFDIIRRVLEDYFKIPVRFMMNITNVDDKIIKGTYQNEYKLEDSFDLNSLEPDKYLDTQKFVDYADHWEKKFFEVMDSVGVKRPNIISRVTEYIQEILDFVDEISKKGFTFVDDGSVYFFGTKFHDIRDDNGEFSTDPKDPNNFVLLKKAKSYEPGWESKYGLIRPGWHIECSAMASNVFGSNFDIHGGGIDLKFPHHHNEMLQSNCRFKEFNEKGKLVGREWVDHFMHTGHLNIEGLKMARSLKNFITVSTILKEYSSQELRMLFLLHGWSEQMDYSDKTMTHATFFLKHFENFFKQIDSILLRSSVLKHQKFGEEEIKLSKYLEKSQQKVNQHLRDNIDTPNVIKTLHDLSSVLFTYVSENDKNSLSEELIIDISRFVESTLNVFGLNIKPDSSSESKSDSDGKSQKLLKVIADIRTDLRVIAKDINTKIKPLDKVLAKEIPQALYQLTDRVRDKDLPAIGVQLTDK